MTRGLRKKTSADLAKLIGWLSADVMAVLWATGPATVSDITAALNDQGREKEVVWGSVATICDRLAERGYVRRNDDGPHITYVAAMDASSVLDDRADRDVLRVIARYGSRTVVAFARAVKRDPKLLAILLEELDGKQIER